ncbi:MAG TPA: O-antigen ligase family protein [Rhizomicrobium sp.]|jgi:O-antigen ligase|nr:O-antigen ligase family protein [Rhizomicrobium sp.]
MNLALAVLAAGWIAWTLLRTSDRPGLFGGVTLSAYGFSTFLGGIGGPLGLIALLLALAELSRRRDRPPLVAELALFGWGALSLASMFYAPDFDLALTGGEFLFAFVASAYLYGRAFGDRPGFWLDVALAGGVSLILCEPALLIHSGAAARQAGNLNAVGMSLIVDAPAVACLTLLLLDDTLRGWRLAGVVAVLVLVLLPISLSYGTRSMFLGAGAAALILLASRMCAPQRGRFLLRLAGGIAAVAAIGAVAVLALPSRGGVVFLRMARRSIAFVETSGHYDPSAHERLASWHAAWSLVQDAPLLGYGVYAFNTVGNTIESYPYKFDVYPHNLVLEILVSTGLLGFALFLAGTVPIFVAGLRRTFSRPVDLASAFAVALFADMLVRHELSVTVLAGRALFLALGMIAAQGHPGRAAPPQTWRMRAGRDMAAP